MRSLTIRLMLVLAVCVSGVRAAGAAAQPAPVAAASSEGAGQSAGEDGQQAELPVSLDRIRAGLSRPLTQPLFSRLDERPHFTIAIEERQKFEELIERLKVEPGPVFTPPGGIYAQEIQRLAFNPTSRPLMQPYAAFNGGQLLTIAIENLIAKYLGGRVMNAVTSAQRARAEAAARAEVARAIHDYCSAQADGGSGLVVCQDPAGAR
jgi:hypothetical protein